MTTRSVEAIHARSDESGPLTFCDWRRYRSAFNEAIGLPAMSEHLPGVTMNGAAGRLVLASGDGRVVISGGADFGPASDTLTFTFLARAEAAQLGPLGDRREA